MCKTVVMRVVSSEMGREALMMVGPGRGEGPRMTPRGLACAASSEKVRPRQR